MVHLKQYIKEFLRFFLYFFIGIYRTIGTTHMGGCCKYSPSCSQYAMEAIQMHNPFTAIKLIILRLLRCRPGVFGGFDPVPAISQCKEQQHGK